MAVDLLAPSLSLIITTLLVFLSPVVAVGWLIVRLVRRNRPLDQGVNGRHPQQERLVELEERIEAVAAETRRLDEAQRFTTAILTQSRGPQAIERPAV